MGFDPSIHHRRSIRLPGYDYSQSGAYFITICTHHHFARFGRIEDGMMILNDWGIIAHQEWERLPERFPGIETDIFQIMPNHGHGIIFIHDSVGAGLAPADAPGRPRGSPRRPAIGEIVGAYKSIVFHKCLVACKEQNVQLGKLWQRNYYEHIIRDDDSYASIVEYILGNPLNWDRDKLNPGTP